MKACESAPILLVLTGPVSYIDLPTLTFMIRLSFNSLTPPVFLLDMLFVLNPDIQSH